MTSFLLICMAWANGDVDAVYEHFDTANEHLIAGEYEKAVAGFTLVLDICRDDPSNTDLRVGAFLGRAEAWLELSDAEKALEDCNAALQLDPENIDGYYVRSEAYDMLGDSERAAADLRRGEGLFRRDYERLLDAYDTDLPITDIGSALHYIHFRPGKAAPVLWAFVAVLCFAFGWRQRVDGGGTVRRLVWVSAAAALLAIAPWLTFTAVWELWRQFPEIINFWPNYPHVVLPATVFSVIYVGLSLRPPVRFIDQRQLQLPLVEDAQFLARVQVLAERIGIHVPRVRLLRSLSDSMAAEAFAGGLPAPSLVVTDGVLHRLTSSERDAVLGHEMAHIANRSLWTLSAVIPLACTAAVIASAYLASALAFGVAVYVGLRRIVGRPVEFDCDRRAAEAIGFREMSSALRKTHAHGVHPIRNTGWLSLLIYAMATHPALDRRLEALYRKSPETDRPEVMFSDEAVRRHRRAAWIALAVWIAVLAASFPVEQRVPHVWLATVMLLLTSLLPIALTWLGARRSLRREKRRLGTLVEWKSLLRLLAVLVLVIPLVFWYWDPYLDRSLSVAVPAMLALLIIAASRWSRTSRLRQQVVEAIHNRDYEHALELGRAHPKKVARDHLLRYDLALASALSGSRRQAVAELEQLRQQKPRCMLASLVLGTLYLNANQPERALKIAQDIMPGLKNDSAPYFLAARALRHLGRLHEAQQAVDQALAVDPDTGPAYALAAGLALDRGETALAQELIQQAHDVAPGDAYTLLVQAQISLASDSTPQARRSVETAVSAIQANPFSFLDFERACLEDNLSRLTAPGQTEQTMQ